MCIKYISYSWASCFIFNWCKCILFGLYGSNNQNNWQSDWFVLNWLINELVSSACIVDSIDSIHNTLSWLTIGFRVCISKTAKFLAGMCEFTKQKLLTTFFQRNIREVVWKVNIKTMQAQWIEKNLPIPLNSKFFVGKLCLFCIDNIKLTVHYKIHKSNINIFELDMVN